MEYDAVKIEWGCKKQLFQLKMAVSTSGNVCPSKKQGTVILIHSNNFVTTYIGLIRFAVGLVGFQTKGSHCN